MIKNPEYFLTIVQEGSISRAADKLYLSQPYLSQYLARLERSLGVTLLERAHPPVRLTPAGELFRAYLVSQGYLERQLQNDLQQLQDQQKRTVHIGVATWRGSILLPDLLPQYSRRWPDVQVVLHERPAPRLEELIENKAVEFCIMHIPAETGERTYELIMHERILLVGRRDHPLIVRQLERGDDAPFDLSSLEQETLFMLPKDWRVTRMLRNLFDVCSLKPCRIITTTNLTTAVNLVTEGLGFTFLPESGLSRCHRPETLACFPVDDPPLTCPLAAVYQKRGFLTPAARGFIDLAKEFYGRSEPAANITSG